MLGRSVNLTTLFLGRLRPPKRLTSTSCTYFRQKVIKRKEKQKYVARPGIEPRTPDLRVRCPTDCATRPGLGTMSYPSISSVYLQHLELRISTPYKCSLVGLHGGWRAREMNYSYSSSCPPNFKCQIVSTYLETHT